MTSTTAYERKSAGNAGIGLFATRDIAENDIIWEEERPFLAVLDSSRLKDACSWCFKYVGETDQEHGKLKVCTGCKILRFCDVTCQTAAWKHSHKLECKIYCRLYPAVLPNTARMLVQLLLRRKTSLMKQEELDRFLALQHHLEDFAKTSGTENDHYENLQLMARAGQEYSGTGDNLSQVETVAGRVLINTLTLPTPLYTPIGLAVSLNSSQLNHSCAPNTVHVFSGSKHTLKATKPIEKGIELTTSYIDNSFPPVVRQSELLNRYFFTCSCSACSATQTLDRPDPPSALKKLPEKGLEELLEVEDSAAELLMGATGQNSSVALPQLARAMAKFTTPPVTTIHYPAWRQPLSKIRSELILALLTLKRWVPALIQSLIQYLDADSVTYSSPIHPVRVARLWVLARLVNEIASKANESQEKSDEGMFGEVEAAKALSERFQIEWGVLVWLMVSEAANNVVQSHGPHNTLTVEVLKEFSTIRNEMRAMGGAEPSQETLKPARERLKEMAKDGWSWWKEWERKRIEKSGRLVSQDAELKGILNGMELLYSDDPE